ncbi:MAG: hypothetical protein C0478_14085 [Planctomyces sp.]|nr:hypothetical protein [Planctomyces sp.]
MIRLVDGFSMNIGEYIQDIEAAVTRFRQKVATCECPQRLLQVAEATKKEIRKLEKAANFRLACTGVIKLTKLETKLNLEVQTAINSIETIVQSIESTLSSDEIDI